MGLLLLMIMLLFLLEGEGYYAYRSGCYGERGFGGSLARLVRQNGPELPQAVRFWCDQCQQRAAESVLSLSAAQMKTDVWRVLPRRPRFARPNDRALLAGR